ncbi:MAG: KH domain-containing protein [Chloroflexi bacterium]|nr:MAG: RNA-binding protein [Phototrophicales bacterium]RMF76932.1 MAG: KH domain-containing protein [Chloroflexota bacterium]
MEELIEYIAKSLVDDPSQVKVSRRVSGSTIILELRVAPEDTGRIIGKRGAVANAMRTLLRTMPTRRRERVVLKIL